MVVNAELDAYSKAAKELTEEGLGLVKSLFPNAYKSSDYLCNAEGLVNFDALQEVVNALGIEAKIKPFSGNVFLARKNDLEKRLKVLEGDLKLMRQQLVVDGAIVQIHVPNFSLLAINQVKVLEDACTDDIQAVLDEGWRILAVCPPLQERRPTYICGRHVPEPR